MEQTNFEALAELSAKNNVLVSVTTKTEDVDMHITFTPYGYHQEAEEPELAYKDDFEEDSNDEEDCDVSLLSYVLNDAAIDELRDALIRAVLRECCGNANKARSKIVDLMHEMCRRINNMEGDG